MSTMDYQLTIRTMLERARRFFPRKEIASWTPAGMFRHTYADHYRRVCQLAHGLAALGVGRGDKVATIAWNNHRHLEAYFAVPCMGAVTHTVNFRLPPEHLVYIINHAENKVLLVDEDFLPLVEAVYPKLTTVKAYVIMTDKDHVETRLPGAIRYEELLAGQPDQYPWPEDLNEKEPAGLCFTSATTGNPKGVVYTHRAIVLHAMTICMADTIGVSEKDVLLPLVPMFHVNAWGTPFAAVWMGSKLVLPGAALRDLPAIGRMCQDERVTLTAAVPTMWLGMLQVMAKMDLDLSSLREIIVGGAAAPRSMIETYEKRFDIQICHAYGMTEAAPLSHVCRVKSYMADWSEDARYTVRAKQGLLAPGLEMRVVDQITGADVPADGRTMGEIWLRGPWVADEYYRDERSAQTFVEGWYRTGDVATLDDEGYINIMDRTKDVVKSGGEWISTVELENAIMAMADVAEAAVVGIAHPRWDERPLACVVPRADARDRLTAAAVRDFLGNRFPRWWVPDDVVFVDEIPKTSTMKFDKKVLRSRFSEHYTANR